MPEKFRSLKHPLKSLCKTNDSFILINNIVLNIDNLRYHILSFTKLYFIYLFDNNQEFPVLNRDFLLCVVRCLTLSSKKRAPFTKNIELFNNVIHFYERSYSNIYKPSETDIDKYTGLRSIIYYMITDIVTDIENNIKMRFYNHLRNYMRSFILLNHPSISLCIEKQLLQKLINKYTNVNIKSVYETTHLDNIITHDVNKSIPYDLECNPQKYLKGMFYMARFCEEHHFSYLNVLPLKKSIIPGHMRMDAETLISIFKLGSKYNGDIKTYKEYIWSLFFKTDKKIFKECNEYKFTGSIQTDGISMTVLFSKIVKEKDKKFEELYIDEIKQSKRVLLKNKEIISIDPNKDDLIYCTSGEKNNNLKQFRYTQNQRSKETRKRKYKKILEIEKKKNGICEEELKISACNSKTTKYELFKDYIIVKNQVISTLKEFYEKEIWRKWKLSVYVKTKQSEEKMIKSFKNKFGTPEESFIAFGDWSQKEQMKYKEPSKGKSFRSLFRKHGYEVLLIDEYRTSKMCCNCKSVEGICEKFLLKESPRPWRKKNGMNLCHGLVKCKICLTMFNRDMNSSINIRMIASSALANKKKERERPEYLQRNSSGDVAISSDKALDTHETVRESEHL